LGGTRHPALTHWANFWRAYGAGGVPVLKRKERFIAPRACDAKPYVAPQTPLPPTAGRLNDGERGRSRPSRLKLPRTERSGATRWKRKRFGGTVDPALARWANFWRALQKTADTRGMPPALGSAGGKSLACSVQPSHFQHLCNPPCKPSAINTCTSVSFQTTYNRCSSHTCKPRFSQLFPLQHMRKKELRSARRHLGVRRLAAGFTAETMTPHGSFASNGLRRKSGSKLPHSKIPRMATWKVAATAARNDRREAAGLPPEGGGLKRARTRPALHLENPRTDLKVGHYKGKPAGGGALTSENEFGWPTLSGFDMVGRFSLECDPI